MIEKFQKVFDSDYKFYEFAKTCGANVGETAKEKPAEGQQTEIERLRALGKRAVAQRDEWERRAIAAEARVKELLERPAASQTSGADRRFDELKRLLAREFRPDHSKTDGIERIVRAEIFKILWPKVEDISRSSR